MRQNYIQTVVIPAHAAIQAAQEALAAQQAIIPTPIIQQPVQTASASASDPMTEIFTRESGNNPAAINISSGACGLGQAYPCSKMPCSLDDYNCQVAFFTQYALSRYGSWANAWTHWQEYGNW